MTYSKNENETKFDHIKRLVGYKISGEFTGTYSEWYKLALEKNLSEDVARRQYYGIKDIILSMNDEEQESLAKKIETMNNMDTFAALQELKKERMKLNDERNILNTYLREQSRYEKIREDILKELKNFPKIDIPKIRENKENDKYGVLCIADEHYDSTFEIKGLKGEILNKYDKETFEKRMWKIIDYTKEIVEKNGLSHIQIYDLGDDIEGILRFSALNHIKLGITQSCIELAKFMIVWLNELSKYVNIRFTKVAGNHEDLRLLSGKKGDFPTENMSGIITYIIKLGLKENKNIEIVELNDNAIAYDNIGGIDILATHELDNDKFKIIKDYENIYNVNINLVIGGHSHYANSTTVGINKEVIGVPSIIGIDDFSMRLKKTSNAGAKFLILKENYGKYCEFNLKLN